jgi:hypothetical protein
MAAMAALMSNLGTPSETFAMSPDSRASDIVAQLQENSTKRLAPPEPPPPRA